MVFREKCSTTHALISITVSIRKSIDNNEFDCGIFTNLKKAFDTINLAFALDWNLQVGEVKVSAVYSVRNLGAWLAANMNMTTHINTICQSIYYHLHNIRRIRKYLSYDNRKSIEQAVIMSRLDYCNGLLYGTPAVHLGKLQRLQNAAARLVCTVSRYDHITPSLISLHWLPVTHRIEFKIAMLVHYYIYGVAPQYLYDLIKIKVSSR